MSVPFLAGATSQSVDIFLKDSSSTTGAGLAGLVYNTASLTAYYRIGATGTATAITLATQTVGGAWSSGGFVEIDATNTKGMYRLDIPDAVLASAALVTIYVQGAANLAPTPLRIDCRPVPKVTLADTATTLTNLPAITSNWLTAAGIAASALDGKGDWNVGKTGYTLTVTTGLGNQTANITGNVSGSVGSVTGAVGSVTGAVGSVTGAVGSVIGAVASVTGNVGGNVTGSVGSVVGHINQTGDNYALANGVAGFVAIDTVVDAIKVVTDQFVFTVANQVDANALTGGGDATAANQTTILADIAIAQADLDIITGADGVVLLSGTQASIAAIEVDTGTTLQAELDGIQADTEDIQTQIGTAGAGLTALPAHGATTGTADSGSTTTLVDAALTQADNDYWKGSLVRFTSGTIDGQTRLITGFTAATDTITFEPATTQAVGTNTYELLPFGLANLLAATQASIDAIEADTNELQTDDVPGLIATAQADLDIITGASGVVLLTATQASIDAIEADTNELQGDDVPGLIATAQSDLDIITGASGVNLLTATQASIDAIEADTNELQADDYPTTLATLATAAALVTVDSVVDAIKVITDALVATAAARLALSAGQIITGTVDTVTNTHTPTTTEFQADDITEATADHYNGRIVIFTSGVLAGQATAITDYAAVGGIGQFTVTAMTEAPANNDTFIIV